MKKEEFEALRNEYAISKRRKVETFHVIWKAIFDEFGMNQFNNVVQWMENFVYLDETAFLATTWRVPTVLNTVRQKVALSSLKNPDFIVENRAPQDEAIATVIGEAFRAVKDQLAWTQTQRKISLWSMLTGTGIAKVGLSSQYVYGETAWADSIPGGVKDLHGIDEYLGYGPTTEFQNTAVRNEWPNLISVPTTDIFHNPGVRRMEDIGRTYHRYRRRLVDVKHDARYTRDFRRKVTETLFRQDSVDGYFISQIGTDYLDDTQYVELVECFDHCSRSFMVFCEEVDVPAREWTGFGLPVDSPYIYQTPIEHPECVWGIPDAFLILPLAQNKNRLRMKYADAINRDGKKLHFYDPLEIDKATWVDEVNSAPDGAFMPYPGLSRADRVPIQTVEFGGANAGILQLSAQVEVDLAETSGLTDAARNVKSPGDTTATEVNTRNFQQSLSLDQYQQINEEFQEACAASLCQIMLSEWPDSQMVKIVGSRPEIFFWVPVERRRVLNDFNLRIVAGSTERLDKVTMRRQWNELLPQLVTLADRAVAAQQMQMQGQTSPLNYEELIRITLDQYDTTLAYKVLNNRDPIALLQRLISQHGMYPAGISAAMAQQIRTMASQSPYEQPGQQSNEVMGANIEPFPGRAPMAAPATPMQPNGPAPQDMSGFGTGRAASEVMR